MVRLITRAVGGVGNILAMAPWTETSKWFTQEAKPGRGIFSGRHPSLLWKVMSGWQVVTRLIYLVAKQMRAETITPQAVQLLCRGADGGQELWQAGAHWVRR